CGGWKISRPAASGGGCGRIHRAGGSRPRHSFGGEGTDFYKGLYRRQGKRTGPCDCKDPCPADGRGYPGFRRRSRRNTLCGNASEEKLEKSEISDRKKRNPFCILKT